MKQIKSITVNHTKYNVIEVLAQDIWNDEIDIEFKYENGNYHHYKSWCDKGIVEWSEN